MASNNTTNFVLRLRTQGFDEAADKAKKIKDNLEAAAVAARQIGPAMQGGTAGAPGGSGGPVPPMPVPPPGGSRGSRNISQSPAANPTGAISDVDPEGTGYRRQRGVIGTGAEARDFSRQAQGLGGLVRVYATLAANLYAATAAFNALSEAANVQNLISGLDQLSANSGQNLGRVAQDLVKVTDGSISLQEAFKVVAKASSAGISTDNIKRLGEVAQRSAQALGIDAATAVDRLSRGITKLEPELLDELGLFTKIGPATEAYARQVGKSSLALTDFEKRQAFANAVLTEGEQKFGAIALQGNPYTKLAAQLKELSITVLNFVNKGVIPLVELLTSNPIALAGAIALFAKSILGFAVPAIASWRNDMKAASEQARDLATRAVNARREQRAWRDSVIGVQVAENSRLATQRSALALTELQNKALLQTRDISAETKRLVGGVSPTMSLGDPAQMAAAEKFVKDLEKRKADLEARGAGFTRQSDIARNKAEIEMIDKSAVALKARIEAEKEFNRIANEPRPRWGTAAAEDDARARRYLQDAQKKSIISNALEAQSLDGLKAGFKSLIEGIKNAQRGLDATGQAVADGTPRMGLFGTVITGAAGAVQLLGAALSAVFGLIQKVLLGIGIATAVFQGFNFFLTNSKKETQAFDDATNKLTGSIKVAADALDVIASKKFLDAKSVQATANSLEELSNGLQKQIKTFGDLRSAQSGWDKWWDNRWASIGRGSEDDLAKNITDTIIQALSLVDANDRNRVAKQIQDALGLQNIDILQLDKKGLKKIIVEDIGKGAVNAESVAVALKGISREANNAAASLTQLDAGLTEISKQVTDLNNSLKFSDTQGKLGVALIEESERVNKALSSTKTGIIALQKITNDFNLISLFPPERAEELAREKAGINELSEKYQQAEVKLKQLRQRQLAGGNAQEQAVVAAQIREAEIAFNKASENAKIAVDKFKTTIESGIIEAAFKKVQESLKNAIVQAGIESAKGYLSILSSLGVATAKQETELKLQEIQIQKSLIQEQYNNSQQLVKLRLVAEQQLQLDTILLNLKRKENADTEAATKNKSIVEAKEFVAKQPGYQQAEFAQKLGFSTITAAVQGDLKFKEKFDKYLGEQTALARSAQVTADQVKTEAETNIRAASKAFNEVAQARYDLWEGEKVNSKAVEKAARTSGTFTSNIAKQLFANNAQLQAALSKLDAQVGVLKLEGKIKQIDEATKTKAGEQERAAEAAGIELQRLDTIQQISGQYSEQLNIKRKSAELDKFFAENQKESLILSGEEEKLQTVITATKLRLAQFEKSKDKTGIQRETEALANTQKILSALDEKRNNASKKAAEDRFNIENKYAQERVTEQLRLDKIVEDKRKQAAEESRQLRGEQLSLEEAILDIASKQENADQKAIAARREELGLTRLRLERETQIASIQEKFAPQLDKQKESRTRISAAIEASQIVGPDAERYDTAKTAELRKELVATDAETARINEQLNAAIGFYEKIFGIKLDIFRVTSEQAAKEAELAALAQKQQERSASLAASMDLAVQAFGGNFENALKGVVGAIDSATAAQETYNLKRSQQQEIVDRLNKKEEKAGELSAEQAKERSEALKNLNKLDKQNSIDQFANQARIAGQAKTLFKEKTAAFKILAAIEKANTIASLAANAQVIAANLAALPVKIANGVASLFGQGGFAGFAGAAAFLALMASLGFGGSKSVSAPPGGFTSEEQQKVQGTGEAYVDGKKVTRAGALAEDPTAKAESVTKALNIFSKASFDNLEYSNKMLTALKMIEQNTRGLSSAMMRSLGPQRAGSLAGGIPQGELRGNYFSGGKGAIAGAGLGAGLGYLAGGSALAMGAISGAVSTLSMGLVTAISGAILPVIGLFLAKPLGKLLGSVFGGKITQSVEDFGIRVKGTFNDIISGIDKSVEEFANVKTVRKGGWFRSDKTTFSTQAQEASKAIKDYVGNLFMGMKDSLVAAGDVLGKDVRGFFQTYVVQGFKVSAKGLSGEELAKAIEGEVSIAFNAAAAAAFPEFERFAEPFEEAGETIIRLARQVQVFDLALKTMGGALTRTINISLDAATITETKTTTTQVGTATRDVVTEGEQDVTDYISDFTYKVFTRSISQVEEPIYSVVTETITRPLTDAEKQLKRVEISNALIAAAGGLEKFTEQVNFYAENFLTDAERLAPIQASLTDELNRLGLSSVDTREEFKATINAIDLTTTEGQQLYTALMAIAPAFALVYKEGTKVLSAEEFRIKLYDQETRILELLGRDQDLLNRKREKERDEIRKYGGAQKDVLLANQEYIYALEDENKIREKLIKQRDKEKKALEDTIKTLQSAIDALQNYKKNLLTSDLTTLTPLQQYQQNKAEFDTLSAVLASSTSTAEEKAAAASKLPAAADKLLNSSRTLFASSSRYQEDFDKVLSVIDSSTAFLEAQKTDAEKQLQVLMESTAFLDSIEDNTKTTADLMRDLEAANKRSEDARKLAIDTAEKWQVDVLDALTIDRSLNIDYQLLGSTITSAITGTGESSSTSTGNAIATTGTVAAAVESNQGYLQNQLDELIKISSTSSMIHQCLQDIEVSLTTSESNRVVDEEITKVWQEEVLRTLNNINVPTNNIDIGELLDINQKMLAELKLLREEQQEQTAAIVTTNMEVTKEAAKIVVAGTDEAISSSTWTATIKPTVDSTTAMY